MSWYRDTTSTKDLAYSPPKVTEQKLDAGGNYVSIAPDGTLQSADGSSGTTTLGASGGIGEP
jgi:hypothetical protein